MRWVPIAQSWPALQAEPGWRGIRKTRLGREIAFALGLLVATLVDAASVKLTHDGTGNLVSVISTSPGVPTIVTPPLGVALADPGDSVSLSVSITSASPVSYQWKFNGDDIPGANGDTLFVPNVTVANEGSYTVVITNSSGSVTSDPAVVTVNTAQVIAWGRNNNGQSTVPAGLNHVVAIASGGNHSLALRADGTVAAWGLNDSGQTTIPGGLNNVVAIAAGGIHSLALKADGTIVAWGYNGNFQTTVPAGLANVKAIAAGSGHNLALKADGTVVGWGYNFYGQASVPVGLNSVVAIAAGGNTSMALKSDGTVVQWGQIDTGFGSVPKPANLSGVVAIATGGWDTLLALKSDGTVVAWGSGLGVDRFPPTLSNVVAIAAGGVHGLALKSDGTVVGWGADSDRQTGPSLGLQRVIAIAAADNASMALLAEDLREDDPVILNTPDFLTGLDSSVHYQINAQNHPTLYGATGLPDGLVLNTATGLITGTPTVSGIFAVVLSATNSSGTTQKNLTLKVNLPVPAIALASLPRVAVGNAFNIQLTASNSPTTFQATGLPDDVSLNQATGLISGTVSVPGTFPITLSATNTYGSGPSTVLNLEVQTILVWGRNDDQQTVVPPGLSTVVALAPGITHVLGLKADGTVTAWGSSTSSASSVPVGLSGVVAVSAGNFSSLALRSNGTLVAWGNNAFQLPAGLTHIAAISSRNNHCLALKADGTVVAWGSNGSGESNVPAGLSGVVAIAAGHDFSLALKSDGTVVAWGSNSSGQATVPGGLNNVVAIAAGVDHSLALKSDGTVVGWGHNVSDDTILPAGTGPVVAIAAGSFFSQALKADGSVVAWGSSSSSETPFPLPAATNVISVGCGHSNGVALFTTRVDGTKPVIINAPFAMARLTNAFQLRVRALNTPTSFGATGLPGGLSINSTTGVISGTPTVVGTFNVTLSATNAAGNTTQSLSLKVLPTGTPDIAVEQPAGTNLVSGNSSKSFGTVVVGNSSSLTFTIKNTGSNAALNLGTITIDGTNSSDFSVTTNPPASVAAAGSTTFVVRFSPTALGSKSATLHIPSDDPDEGSFAIAITGTGAPPPGVVEINGTAFTVNENGVSAAILLKRTNGTGGSVTVKITSTNGTAFAGSDFTASATNTATFNDGSSTATGFVPIFNSPSTSEPNETFTVTISSPGNGATLGVQTSATVTIMDSSSLSTLLDSTPPLAPVINAPAANALFPLNDGGAVTISGTATDTQGVKRVQVSLDGINFVDASLVPPGAPTTAFSTTVVPKGGVNTVQVKSTDYANRVSPSPHAVSG